MARFEGIADAGNEVRRYLIKNDEVGPQHLRSQLDELTKIGTSPVLTVVNFIEMVYAHPDDFPAEAKELAAEAVLITEEHNFHGHGVDERGARIGKVLRGVAVAAKNKPEMLQQYAKPVDTLAAPVPMQSGPITAEE